MLTRFAPVAGMIGCLMMAPAVSPLAMAQPVPVDVELVLAVDISGSIDEQEARMQRQGYLSAIVSPEVLEAVQSGPFGRIAVVYVEWSGDDLQETVIDWTLIEDEVSASVFADALAEAPRQIGRWTSISGAIDYAVPLFDGNGYEGARRVIDISGDGFNNRGRQVTQARDDAVAAGIVINGLPILNERPSPGGWPAAAKLDDYFESHVIGGPGAFVLPAQGFEDFAHAILTKLVLEIAGLVPGDTAVTDLASLSISEPR